MRALLTAITVILTSAPPCYAREPIAVFLSIGQSNGGGQGDGSHSTQIIPGTVLQYAPQICSGNEFLCDANDPVRRSSPNRGATVGGSMWPSFGSVYYSLTKTKVLIVPATRGSTSTCESAATGSGDWSAGGKLIQVALAELESAKVAAYQRGFVPKIGGVIYNDGESDGDAIDSHLITRIDYRLCLTGLYFYLKRKIPDVPFYIVRLGATGNPSPGWDAVRDEQERLAKSYRGVMIVSRLASCLHHLGLNNDDKVHWSQWGLNLVGRQAAYSIASGKEPDYGIDCR